VSAPDVAAAVIPADLAPLNAYLVEYAVKEITRRNGGAPAVMHDLAELLAILRMPAPSVSGRPRPMLPMRAERFLTVSEAVVITGLSDRQVRRLAAEQVLIARKKGRDWQIDADSAAGYGQRRRTWQQPAA
jgi:hypothetical protein